MNKRRLHVQKQMKSNYSKRDWVGVIIKDNKPEKGEREKENLDTEEQMLCVLSIELPTEVQVSHVWLMDMDLDMNMLVFSSVAQLCPTLCDSMECSTPGLPVITNSRSSLKLMSIELVMPSNHLILCCPLFLPPSIFPSIRVFSSESVLCIRWPKY